MSGYGSRSVSPNKLITSKSSFFPTSVFSPVFLSELSSPKLLFQDSYHSTGYEPKNDVLFARSLDQDLH